MATVRITGDVSHRVRDRIEAMRDAELQREVPDLEKAFAIDASVLYNTCYWGAQHTHLIEVIPKDWLSKANSGSITLSVDHNDFNFQTSVHFTQMNSAYECPKPGQYYRNRSTITPDQVRAFPEGTPGRAELLQRAQDAVTSREIVARWTKVRDDIGEFLSKCKSLNEAVKLFPAVRMYIAKADLERLDQKVARPLQRSELVANLDTGGLTAAAIAAKLHGAA